MATGLNEIILGLEELRDSRLQTGSDIFLVVDALVDVAKELLDLRDDHSEKIHKLRQDVFPLMNVKD